MSVVWSDEDWLFSGILNLKQCYTVLLNVLAKLLVNWLLICEKLAVKSFKILLFIFGLIAFLTKYVIDIKKLHTL